MTSCLIRPPRILFTAELFIPQAEGGWYIREVGLWMDDGTLFAVGNTPLTEKPDISSGAATDLLVRLIIRVLDAATVSIEIDPAQVLATREYVDRKLDAHNKDGGAHETLARKSVQIKAGTGLTGGGTLEADRTLTVKYGNTAGTACQGNDVRLADARTPKPHKATHQTGGSDAITPADIGAADKTIQIKPGTGLTGGGTLEADRTLTVKYGNTAGTACQGNDVRLADARTPKPHKATHQTGGSDAITPADIGAADKTIQIKPGTGLTGGGTLEADRTLTVKYGNTAGTACQGNDARLSNARTPTAHKVHTQDWGHGRAHSCGHRRGPCFAYKRGGYGYRVGPCQSLPNNAKGRRNRRCRYGEKHVCTGRSCASCADHDHWERWHGDEAVYRPDD